MWARKGAGVTQISYFRVGLAAASCVCKRLNCSVSSWMDRTVAGRCPENGCVRGLGGSVVAGQHSWCHRSEQCVPRTRLVHLAQ